MYMLLFHLHENIYLAFENIFSQKNFISIKKKQNISVSGQYRTIFYTNNPYINLILLILYHAFNIVLATKKLKNCHI